MPRSQDKPKPPRRLSRTIEPSLAEDLDSFLSSPAYSEAQDNPRPLRVTALLAMAVLQDTMRPADLKRIGKANGLAVVVAVPGPDWVEPIAQALARAGTWNEVVKRTGTSRMQDKPDVGREMIAETLASGSTRSASAKARTATCPRTSSPWLTSASR